MARKIKYKIRGRWFYELAIHDDLMLLRDRLGNKYLKPLSELKHYTPVMDFTI